MKSAGQQSKKTRTTVQVKGFDEEMPRHSYRRTPVRSDFITFPTFPMPASLANASNPCEQQSPATPRDGDARQRGRAATLHSAGTSARDCETKAGAFRLVGARFGTPGVRSVVGGGCFGCGTS